MTLKAIQTEYKGYLFRSRLEARWAVFLDSLGLGYEYEPEGFDLDGEWYLPDFKLERLWLEIKGQPPSGRERHLALLLHKASGSDVALMWGQPWTDTPMYFYKRGSEWNEENASLLFHAHLFFHIKPPFVDEESFMARVVAIETAFVRARQARFEHGETPQ